MGWERTRAPGAAERQAIGGNAALTTLSGQPESLAQRRERPLVVNLWATWCPPCRREMPVFAQAQRREQDIEFVFINQGESTATVTKYLDKEQLELRNVYLDVQSEWSLQLGADAMPTTLFFDEHGVLVGSHTGELSAASLKQALKRFAQPQKSSAGLVNRLLSLTCAGFKSEYAQAQLE